MIKSGTLLNRLDKNIEICTICNELIKTKNNINSLSKEYKFLKWCDKIYKECELYHEKCDNNFKINHQTIFNRLDKNVEICTICNPLKPLPDSIKFDDNYKIITSHVKYKIIKHVVCDKEFSITDDTLGYRLGKNMEICTICNPRQDYKPILLPNEYKILSVNQKHKVILHHKCGKEFEIKKATIRNRLINKDEICLICNPLQKQYSKLEIDMVNFIESIYDDIVMSEKTLKFRIGLSTLDAYLPKLKLGIEFYGDYYHANPKFYEATHIMKEYNTASDLWKRDVRKINLFKRNDIEIFVIWEYDWLNNTESVKQQLRLKLSY